MKRGLLVPTGNIECNLISFAADRQHSATSPAVPSFQQYNFSEEPFQNTGSNCREKHSRSLTANSVRRNWEHGERLLRVHSAHVLHTAISSGSSREEKGSNDLEASRRRTAPLFHMRRRRKTTTRTEAVARSKRDVGRKISSPSLRNDVTRAPCHGNEEGLQPLEDLQRKFNLKREMRIGGYAEGNTTSSPSKPNKTERLRFQAKRGVKKSKKHVKWKNSLLPLPTGSDFDHLVRSGVLAKHIASKEKKRWR